MMRASLPACYTRHRRAACYVAGDTTLNLLWRVQHGEGPTFSPKVAVVLIGTNDFTNPLYQLVSCPSAGPCCSKHVEQASSHGSYSMPTALQSILRS